MSCGVQSGVQSLPGIEGGHATDMWRTEILILLYVDLF